MVAGFVVEGGFFFELFWSLRPGNFEDNITPGLEILFKVEKLTKNPNPQLKKK